MLLTPPLGEEQFPVPVPVGGRLTQFVHHWEKFTTDVWVLSVIRGGLEQFSWEPRRDENKTLVSTEWEEFPLLLFSVIEIELPRTEDELLLV
jgi:hypothetical protein